jgi:hypothetical protein
MAQLAVAGGGAAVGAVVGTFLIPGLGTAAGAQIGWALGGVAGALLFPPKGADQSGPRLGDLSVQTSGYGVPIPAACGRVKLAGNVIWKQDIRETKRTRRQGKGGGGTRVTTYTYSLSWAVGLCEWLIPPTNAQVLKIWLDTYLVYDTTGDSEVTQVPGLVWRFHDGDEDQFPDPLIAAIEGNEDAPAHRGLAYIVFEAVPLEKFGNRMPNVTVELAADAARSFPEVDVTPPSVVAHAASTPSANTYNNNWPTNVAVDHARGRIYEGRIRTGSGGGADEFIRVYDLVTMAGVADYRMDRVVAPVLPPGVSASSTNATAAILHVGVDGFLYIASGNNARACLLKVDPDSMLAVGAFGPFTGGFSLSSDSTALVIPRQITTVTVPQVGAEPRTLAVVQCYRSACFTIDTDDMTYVWGAISDISPAPINNGFPFFDNFYRATLVPGLVDVPGSDLWWVWSSGSTDTVLQIARVRYGGAAASIGAGAAVGISVALYTLDVAAAVASVGSFCLLRSVWWDQTDNTLVITTVGATVTTGHTFKWSPDGVVWAVTGHAMQQYDDARGFKGRVLSGAWGLGGNLLLQAATGQALVNSASGVPWRNLYWLDEQQAVIGWDNDTSHALATVSKRYLNRIAPNVLVVGDVVEALCTRAGLEAADLNVSALTDWLRGYVLPRPVSARDAIAPLASAFAFDAVEQDDVLLFRKRGGATVAAIAYADMAREDPDGSVLDEQRAQDQDMPQALTVRYMDIARNYEQNAQTWRRPSAPVGVTGANAAAAIDLPIPLLPDEAKTIARRLLTGAWRERTRLTFPVGPRHARLVPTDPITVTTQDGATMRARVLSTQLGGNWLTRIEAVTEDSIAYGLSAVGDGGAGWQAPVLPAPYYVRLMVPDLPLLVDGEDLGQAALREYALVGAYDDRFRAVEFYRSPDLSVWTSLGALVDGATWGSVIAAPAVPASPWIWDELGTVDIALAAGEIDSATDIEALNGTNLAAMIGPDGQAEVFAFRTVTALGGDAYRLSGLLRGRRGTEDQCIRRAAGDLFVLLDEARFGFEAAVSEASATRHHRAVTAFETVETTVSTIAKSARGRAERPYAPAQISASRDGSSNLTVAWVRRTRVGGEWIDGTGTVPLSEGAEAYELDAYDGALPVWAPEYSASENTSLAGNAFDGSTATYWNSLPASGGDGQLRVDYAAPVTLAAYAVTSATAGVLAGRAPRDWTFEGWDGSAWVVLDTRSGEVGWGGLETRSFTIAADSRAGFTGYRLNVSASGDGYSVVVSALEFFLDPAGSIDVARAGAVARTLTVSTAAASYSAANQVTDFGAAQPAIPARIFQVSSIVGRGIAADIVL